MTDDKVQPFVKQWLRAKIDRAKWNCWNGKAVRGLRYLKDVDRPDSAAVAWHAPERQCRPSFPPRSEQLSEEQLRLFGQEPGVEHPAAEQHKDDDDPPPASGSSHREDSQEGLRRGRRPLPSHLKRERMEHDLTEEEKHCASCRQDMRPIGEESSERYEYMPAQLLVIEDICKKYACECTVKTATKPPQPIEKSTAVKGGLKVSHCGGVKGDHPGGCVTKL